MTGASRTPDGFETTFQVNHLAQLLLLDALLARSEPPARVVLTGSGTHDPSRRSGMPAPLEGDADAGAAPRPHPADASGTRLLQAHSVPRGSAADQGWLDIRAPSVAPGSGDAGGEEAEIVGEGAVGEVGDACAQDGDGLGR